MSSSLRTAKLVDSCTVSIGYDTQVKAASTAFDKQMYEIVDETPEVCFIPRIMELLDPVLVDILAWQFHVDFYEPSRDLEFRKQLVQDSIVWHKTKGTVALVQWVLDTYWPGGATIEEWFEYMDPLPPPAPDPVLGWVFAAGDWHDRYRFRISIDQLVIKPEDELDVLRLIERYKPVSRWCEGIFRPKVSQCDIGWAGMALRFISRTSEAPNYP